MDEKKEKKSSPSLYERKVETARVTKKIIREVGGDPKSERAQLLIRNIVRRVK